MANNLKEQAIQTFCIVPEIYQQAFQEAGADFPDELVQQIKEDPQGAMNMLAKDEQLTNAVVQIFQGNQETIMQAVQQASQQSMFKKGGKLEQGLQKFQSGGSLTRKQARELAAVTKGFNNEQFDTAMINAKNALRQSGLRGRALREAARWSIIGSPSNAVQNEEFTIEDLPTEEIYDRPITFAPENLFVEKIKTSKPVGAGSIYNTLASDMLTRIGSTPSNSVSPSTTYQPTTSFTGKNPLDAQLNDANLRSQERERIRQERINNSVSPSTEALQKGGSFTRVIKAVGDTLDTKKYNYSTQTRQTKPDGSIIYSVETRNYSDKYYDPTKTIPSGFRRFINGGMKPVPSEIKENWDEILKNHAGEITIDKTKSRLQKGGSLMKKEKINNKYFSKLEKSGRKSSKEMEDLSQARKAELKKVK